jgi:hypothetical protein
VHRVVVGVDQVVQHPRVLGIAVEEHLQHARGLHEVPVAVGAGLAAGERRADQGEGVEARGLQVVRPALVERAHGLGVGALPCGLLALAIEDLHRGQPSLLAVGGCLGGARLRGGPEALQRGLGGVAVLLRPDGMVVGHRLAPVREGKAGIGLLRVAESVGRFVVPETVERGHTTQEVRLGLGLAGGRKVDAAQVGGLGWGEDQKDQKDR